MKISKVERNEEYIKNKQQKMEYLKHHYGLIETQECSFHPEVRNFTLKNLQKIKTHKK